MELYRGYVELNDNKKAKYSYKKGKPLLSYEDAEKKENYAGVLNDDVILVDIDDEQQSEILKSVVQDLKLNTRIVKTTRGRHFIFKNPIRNKNYLVNKCYTHTTLAIGLTADIKAGIKNSYQVLKFHGVTRTIENEPETIDSLPPFLIPILEAPEFIDMQEGDGRNQNLFNYILTLQKYALSIEDIRQTLTLINKYILSAPLSENELNQIMRDEAFQKPIFYDNKRFMHEVFGDFLQNTYHIKRINGMLHVYMDNVYKPDSKMIEYLMILHIKELTAQRRQEVLKYLNVVCKDNMKMSSVDLILFNNGVYDLKNDEFLEPSPSFIITNQIPHNYNPKAYSAIVDEVLDNLANGNKENRLLLEEMIGFCFYRRSEDGRCFILKGKESNGKSTLLTALFTLLGEDNASSLDLKDLDDRFSTIMLHNKLANIGDDISDQYIPSAGVFKKIVTGNRITAEQKGVDKTEFYPYSKLIFSANNIPRIGKGKDAAAIARRMVIVPLTATFKEDGVTSKTNATFRPYIIDDLISEESMEYLILLAIKGLKRWLTNKKFTMGENVTKAIDEFKHDNNPLLGFFEELQEEGLEQSLDDHTTSDIYTRYNNYCSENGFQALGKNWFVRQLVEHFPDYEIFRKSAKVDGKVLKISLIRKKIDLKTTETDEKVVRQESGNGNSEMTKG